MKKNTSIGQNQSLQMQIYRRVLLEFFAIRVDKQCVKECNVLLQ